MTSNNITRMLLIAGVALVSCNEINPDRDPDGGNVVITATIESEGLTRSCIDPAQYSGGVTGLLWTPDDCLGVYGDAGTGNAKFTNTSTTKSGSTTFSGTLADGEAPQYAYYPYTEANAGKEATALTGSVSAEQSYSQADGLLTDDWKYGELDSSTSTGYKFKMKSLFALAKVVVDATGSPVEGETLESIEIKATVPGSSSTIRCINGSFTFNAVDGTYNLSGDAADGTDNAIKMVWTDKPTLESGKSYTGYISLIPDIAVGDTITITITTNSHTAKFKVPCLKTLEPGNIYNFPMTLTTLAEKMYAAYEKEAKYEEISSGGSGEGGSGEGGEGGSGEGGETTDPEPTVTTGTFTACAFNVDGLPQKISIFTINGDGPGSSGTTTMANIANGLGWDIIAASEDFEYHSQLAAGLSNYNAGTYRGTITSAQLSSRADTDGLCFFWKKGLTVTSEGNSPGSSSWEKTVQYTDEEGGLTSGANTCIKKGFRHYEVEVDATNNVIVDVYITHMNTYSGSGNTESNAYVKAVLSQLRQLRDYVLEKAKANKRPAIIMGDTNMRYTRHDIKTNFLDVVAAYDNNAGYTVSDPWVEFHRGGIYPAWNSLSLMTRFAFAGDKENDILCADNQCGEVVDKIWYINVPGAEVQLKATAHQNDVDNFRKSTSDVSYSGVMVEDTNGSSTSGNTKYNSNQTVSYTKDVGYSDHFPVVTTFQWTKTVAAE
ncbi:MAG: fimbrillin family protein [Bacteroidales bacterium]|nr:fimbrillin family protein [Bacteroidales bacterium]